MNWRQEIDRKIVQEKHFFCEKRDFDFLFPILQKRTDRMKQSTTAHRDFFTIFVQVKNLILKGPGSRLKQTFQKSYHFGYKRFRQFFPRIIEYDKSRGKNCLAPEGVLTLNMADVMYYISVKKNCLKHNFSKKAFSSCKKRHWPIFSRNIMYAKPQGVFSYGSRKWSDKYFVSYRIIS